MQHNFWRLPDGDLPLGSQPTLMGIVNVTPDSFSDGGVYFEPERAIEQGLRLASDGADILDIGGESTRPYASPVAVEEELRRVVTVIKSLKRQTRLPLSIDTSKAAVARVALECGATIINDITALRGDEEMVRVARNWRAGVCLMHMQGTPQTMQDNPQYSDVVAEVAEFLRTRRDTLVEAGLEAESIVLDPGIGFGKTNAHNLELIRNCQRLSELGHPLLVGHSRKAFLAKIVGNKEVERDTATAGAAVALAQQGVRIMRVHEVGMVRRTLQAFAACGGNLATDELGQASGLRESVRPR